MIKAMEELNLKPWLELLLAYEHSGITYIICAGKIIGKVEEDCEEA